MGSERLRPEVGIHGTVFRKAGVVVSSNGIKATVQGSKNPFRPFTRKQAVQYRVLIENCTGKPKTISGDKTAVLAGVADGEPTTRHLVVSGVLQIALALRDDTLFGHDMTLKEIMARMRNVSD